MNTTHLIIGEAATKILQETIALEETLSGDVLTLTEDLHLGPLHINDGENFSTMRKTYWESIGRIFAEDYESDEQKIAKLIAKKTEETRLVFWMAPNALDVNTYYFLLNLCKGNNGLLHVIAIDSLPFFNEKGILFYPKTFAQLLPKEMAKCKHLIKEISPADYEVDGDEWIRISEENGLVRSHDVGKKLSTRNETHFDSAIYLSVNANFVKAHKVLQTCMNKGGLAANELFMAQRIKSLTEQGSFLVQGDATKTLKDFEIKSAKAVVEETVE